MPGLLEEWAEKKIPAIMVPQLHFDASKSGVVRLFGSPTVVGMHYVEAGVPMPRLICPFSIDPRAKCKGCKDHSLTQRWISLGWDCLKRQWCFLMFTDKIKTDIVDKLAAAGATPSDIVDGKGYDIILQRIGKDTDVSLILQTKDELRGPKPPFKEGADKPPSMDSLLEHLKSKSAWKKFDNKDEIAAKFMKTQPFGGRDYRIRTDTDVEARIRELSGDGEVPPVREARQPPKPIPKADDRWDLL